MEADFIRCPTTQSRVGPMLIIPFQDILKLATKPFASQRNRAQSPGNPLDRANRPLDNRDTPVFAHGPKPRCDLVTPAPGLELWADELLALVADDVLRLHSTVAHQAAQEGADCQGGGLLVKDGVPHDPAREMIDHQGHPPTERPALGQGVGQPGDPKAACGWHQRKVHVPDMIGPLGGHHPTSRLFMRRGLRFWNRLGCRPRFRFEPSAYGTHSQGQPRPCRGLRDLRLPMLEQSTFSRWTTEVTISGNLFTGDGIWTKASGPSSSRQRTQEAMVGPVTRKVRAVCSKDQSRAARSSRIDKRSGGG